MDPRSEDSRPVYAEQIFGLNEVLSTNGIQDRFKNYGWKNLTGTKSVVNLMESVDKWYADWILEEDSDDDQSHQDTDPLSILVQANRALKKMANGQDALREESLKASKAIENLIQSAYKPVLEIHRREVRGADYQMIKWFFDDQLPATKEDAAKKKTGQTRRYRPWGLFRYLRLFGDNDDAFSLNAKLRCDRASLSDGAYPESLYPDSAEMSPIERLLYG